MESKEEVNARKASFQKAEALELARAARHLYVAKGKKVVYVDMKKDPPDDEALAKLMLGPTGNLRAPVIRTGKTLIVGFNQETYEKVLG